MFKTYIDKLREKLNAKLDRLDSRMTSLAQDIRHDNQLHAPLCSAATEEELQKSLDSITVSNVILFVR